jgi:hypothetical protein
MGMAKKKSWDEELFNRLHAAGLRKRAARAIAEVTDGRRKTPRTARKTLEDLRGLVSEVEDRVSGGPARRQAAAKKAAATRKRKAAERSAAAKKGARTRARAKSK